MAIKKNRTHLAAVVDISGAPCRLIAAKNMGDKGVIFTPHSALNLEDAGRDLSIREEHVSAWPNALSKKVHIHHTFHLNDEEIWKIDHSSLADNNGDDFATAILATSIPKRSNRLPAVIKSILSALGLNTFGSLDGPRFRQ